jgi:hypothetical protein
VAPQKNGFPSLTDTEDSGRSGPNVLAFATSDPPSPDNINGTVPAQETVSDILNHTLAEFTRPSKI